MTDIESIIEKAEECLMCIRKPCYKGCPLQNDTKGFIELVKNRKYKEAYFLLSKTTVLPSICGRICPHRNQCEGSCIKVRLGKAVEIGKIEAFVGDMALENNWHLDVLPLKDKKVAVVGGGPSGLTCAAFLRRNGYDVTIYEKYDYLGGLLYHGIPSFRLDKTLLKKVIDNILEMGINVKFQNSIGKDFSLDDLEKEYDAVFLGFGANVSNKMNIPFENLEGVIGGYELLEKDIHPNYEDKTVVIIGGGKVAMDLSLTIKRKNAKKVYVIYRRSKRESSIEDKEIDKAKDEGIEFLFQHNILGIYGNNRVEKIEVIKTELIEKNGDDRLYPVNIEDSNYYIDCDYVVMAIGSHPDEVVKTLGVDLDKRERILIDSVGHTSKENVFAGGDLAGAKGTVAFAARSGRDAAYAIMEYLEK